MSALLPFLLLFQAAVAQPPAQPRAAAPAPQYKPEELCVIAGTVYNARTGEPLKKATLMAFKQESRTPTPSSAVTDAGGKFALRRLEPGKYRIEVQRTGFAPSSYGARAPGGAGATLTLQKGQKIEDVSIKLLPQGVVTGRVVDEDGEPVAYVRVNVSRFTYHEGKKQLGPMGGGMTDDRGEYRIFGILPGKYYVSAVYMNRMGLPQTPTSESDVPTYAETYYPGVAEVGQAAMMDVTSGAEVSGIDIRLIKTRAYSIAGRVTNLPAGREAWLSLFPRGDGTGFRWGRENSAMTGAGGAFAFHGVKPGRYLLLAQAPDSDQPQTASTSVEVTDGNVQGVQVSFAPEQAMSGTVRVEGGDPVSLNKLQAVHITLMPHGFDSWGWGARGGEMKDDGAFKITVSVLDRYRVRIWQLPPGYYLKSVRLGREEAPDSVIDLSHGIADLTVTLSANAAEMSGLVKNKDGQPFTGATVVLVPDERDRQDRYYNGTTDQNGQYTIKSVAPGNYKLFAFERTEFGQMYDPDFLKPFENDAVSVTVREKDRLAKDLKALADESAATSSAP